jgi:hypothetical protein
MEITITQHAIEQYRRRSFEYDISDSEVKNLLTRAVKKGRKESRRPPFTRNIFKVTYKDFSIVVDFRDKSTVLTYLGTKEYQRWYYCHEIKPRALCS